MANVAERRLYIVDNGNDYSDHRVYFIDASTGTREALDIVVKLINGPTGRGEMKVWGGGTFDQWEGGSYTLGELLEDCNFSLHSWSECTAEAFVLARLLPPDVRAHAFPFRVEDEIQ